MPFQDAGGFRSSQIVVQLEDKGLDPLDTIEMDQPIDGAVAERVGRSIPLQLGQLLPQSQDTAGDGDFRAGQFIHQFPAGGKERKDPSLEVAEGPGQFIAPHGVAVDSTGAVYVAEVSYTIRGSKMDPPRELRSFSKYARVR